MPRQPWRYDHLTWIEIRDMIRRDPQPVIAIPIGAVEDHGAHMAISTDNDILEGVLAECGRRAAGDLLVLPTIPFGFDEHHMDFPGVIAIDIETTLAYLAQTAISVARHGFSHILIVNGHGSNQSICDLAARKCVLATGAICAATTVNAAVDPALIADVLEQERRGGYGSVGHACEFETALMLHLHPDRVDMRHAERDIGQLKLKYFNWDHPEPSAYAWQDWWSRFSRVGVCGDAAAATPEAGARLFEATVERFVELIREFRTIPIRPRVDHH
ncbi:MAG TPA: creatininase family protein [Roseiflexaceae bacterium]|nr:creatininase family protein [Roseiflexaceae bacterium]HMP40753.1 creatininase family protein [Roseiflexaceae bacterium]